MLFKKARAYAAQRTQAIIARLGKSRLLLQTVDFGEVAEGRLVVETREPGGEWKVHEDHSNLVVRQAEQIMAQMAINQGPGNNNSALSYIELGDPPFPANPPSLNDAGLQASTGQRKAVSVTASGNIVTCVADWSTAEGNGFTYTEAGLFNGLLGAGLMFARKVFAGITKTNAFEMRFTWYITFLVNTQGGDCSGIALVGPSTVAAMTYYVAAGGENSIAATFDFVVGANHVDVFLAGQRLVPGVQYNEAAAPLNAPIGGPPLNKGVNLIGFAANPGDKFFLILRTLS
jgi:hypothetical protein